MSEVHLQLDQNLLGARMPSAGLTFRRPGANIASWTEEYYQNLTMLRSEELFI